METTFATTSRRSLLAFPTTSASGPAGTEVLAEPVRRVSHLLLLVLEHLHRLLLAAPLRVRYTPDLRNNLEPERAPLQLRLPTRPPTATR